MNIIFLDIDGILNYPGIPSYDIVKCENESDQLSKSRIDLLNQFCKKNNIKVVVSSSWRKFRPYPDLVKKLQCYGATFDIIDVTPHTVSDIRGEEIERWLDDTDLDIQQYAIVDDGSDMLPSQQKNFVYIDSWVGITPSAIFKLDKIFRTSTDLNIALFIIAH